MCASFESSDGGNPKKTSRQQQREKSLNFDKAPSHISHVMQTFPIENNFPLAHYPPYSTELSPYDFMIFPKIKIGIKGNHLDSMKNKATAHFRKIPKREF